MPDNKGMLRFPGRTVPPSGGKHPEENPRSGRHAQDVIRRPAMLLYIHGYQGSPGDKFDRVVRVFGGLYEDIRAPQLRNVNVARTGSKHGGGFQEQVSLRLQPKRRQDDQ